ncbi:Gfo/Idh/MocA family protein [Aquimarina pacifica]|uniref:Gfo/Idh/MocA family protein n=1 Tax=Aquimarina pacifica TaxID=1296415 RepID=UPI0004703FD4|nr:Gfo/Idh/MocA family oxidoreductase [Aquimarina pacifica]
MNTIKKTKWGIIGCGKIAHKFAQDLSTVPDALLFAVSSRSLEKAKNFGDTYNAVHCYGTYEELSKNSDIDIIYIATPHVFHYENTLMCLRHKKAVLCEKPFAMNRIQVEEMIDTAKNNNVFLMEGLWTYFLPHYQYVLNALESKEFGAVKKIKADFGFAADFNPDERLFNKNLGGGSLLDVGIYPLFAAVSILGYPEKIEAEATLGKTGVDESCTMQLFYKNDVIASLFSSITQKTNTEAIIECEKGTIFIHSKFHEPSHLTIQKNGVSEKINFDTKTHGYSYEIIHAQKMLSQDCKESTIMSFDRSIELISLLDSVRNIIGLHYVNNTN